MNQFSDTSRPDKNPFREMYAREDSRKKGPSFFGGIARFVLLIMIGCAAGGAGMALQGYFFFTQNLPSIDKLKNYSPPIVSCFYDDKGQLIADFAKERRFVVPAEEMPDLLQQAFVAAEDKNFWMHGGVDKEAIIRAIKKNLLSGQNQRRSEHHNPAGGQDLPALHVTRNSAVKSKKRSCPFGSKGP